MPRDPVPFGPEGLPAFLARTGDPGSCARDYVYAAYRHAYEQGRADERRAGDRSWAAQRARRVRDALTLAELGALRYHVCCRPCRLSGCKPGCGRCETRTGETFGLPHPDDLAPRLAVA